MKGGLLCQKSSEFSEELADFSPRNRIRRLALFGSARRDDFNPDGDVDLLAELEPEAQVGFLA